METMGIALLNPSYAGFAVADELTERLVLFDDDVIGTRQLAA
jgi:hypothetical protein